MNSKLISYNLEFKQFGKEAILIEWPQEISETILLDIRYFVSEIKKNKLQYISDINFVYNSILVMYDSQQINFKTLKSILHNLYLKKKSTNNVSKFVWQIPVCYDEIYGLDLHFLAFEKQCTIEEIIKVHCSTNYLVYGIGFLPGFLYLGGLARELYQPRRVEPRLKVPKGSVGIGGTQTGIYPKNSPGGWQIIGKTPISVFNIKNERPIEIEPGDKIHFFSISMNEFEIIENKCKAGIYEIRKEILDG
jgi:inhibitor of KinA